MRALRSRQVVFTLFAWLATAATALAYAYCNGGRQVVRLLIAVGIIGLLGAVSLSWRACGEIDFRLAAALGIWRLKRLSVVRNSYPAYRFVDLYRAAEALLLASDAIVLDSASTESLNDILQIEQPRWDSRRIRRAARRKWATDEGASSLYPTDRFWVRHGDDGAIVRISYHDQKSKTSVEVAAADSADARSLLDVIAERSERQSIYRGHILEVGFREAAHDEYGDVIEGSSLVVAFPKTAPVRDSEIVLSEAAMRVLHRNVVDVHRHGTLLKRFGVPVRRGVLLHGPPGTGKTFACRYLCTQLDGVTRIFVAGSALAQIKLIVKFATLYSPSLVVLEDFDLVIPSREISGVSGLLGELLDAMDGVRPNQDVVFLLTTNSLARIENAIKDRPGRISQCVFMGAPTDELRRRYLLHYLEPYDASDVDLNALVQWSAGATQAFLKDWVHRAVQIALENEEPPKERLELHTRDFTAAFREMRHRESVANRIVGFLGEMEQREAG